MHQITWLFQVIRNIGYRLKERSHDYHLQLLYLVVFQVVYVSLTTEKKNRKLVLKIYEFLKKNRKAMKVHRFLATPQVSILNKKYKNTFYVEVDVFLQRDKECVRGAKTEIL